MSISVVIPAYNASRYIAETLRSVLAQTLPPDEVLVIDDGSTDDTAAVAERFGPPVRVIRRANARQAASRNFGVQEARGEWVAFIDSDDLWAVDKLEKQMLELARNPQADLCYTARVHFVEEDGVKRVESVIAVPDASGIDAALARNTTFLPSSVVMRRSTFLRSGGFDTQFKVVEDWDLWMRLLNSGTVFAGCREPLLQYRIHTRGVSKNMGVWLAETDQVYRRHIMPKFGLPKRWLHSSRIRSEHESIAALNLRQGGDSSYLPMMLRSIARDPWHNPGRYKVLAHMLYTTATKRMRSDAPRSNSSESAANRSPSPAVATPLVPRKPAHAAHPGPDQVSKAS
jgi:glycosyltransferase involved in cell wall biosynthesis